MSKDYNVPWVYESPDNGKTIYRRRFGDYTNRELVEDENGPHLPVWTRLNGMVISYTPFGYVLIYDADKHENFYFRKEDVLFHDQQNIQIRKGCIRLSEDPSITKQRKIQEQP
jgi:hypothetical protein